MSYATGHTYGYGVQTSDISITSLDRLKSLVHMAPRYEAEINKWFAKTNITEPSIDDYLEYDQDYGLELATLQRAFYPHPA